MTPRVFTVTTRVRWKFALNKHQILRVYPMKYFAGILLSVLFASPALAEDCHFYKHEKRGEPHIAQFANTNLVYNLPSDWTGQISSVWVRKGYYAILFNQALWQGTNIYLYGSGLSFVNKEWQKSAGYPDQENLGTVYELVPLGFNDVPASILCLKA